MAHTPGTQKKLENNKEQEKTPHQAVNKQKIPKVKCFTSMIMQFMPAYCSPEREAGRAAGSTSFPGNIPGDAGQCDPVCNTGYNPTLSLTEQNES